MVLRITTQPTQMDFPLSHSSVNFINLIILGSYDNRDIYHDLYRISSINEERKK